MSEFHSLSEKCVIVGEDGCAGGGTFGGGDSTDQGDCHQVGGDVRYRKGVHHLSQNYYLVNKIFFHTNESKNYKI